MFDTSKIRAELETRKTELQARQERVSKHTRHREDPLPQDFAEQAIELENGETLVALDRELAQELKKIDRALSRIDADEYLNCESCGEPIGEDRLQAMPTSVQCIDCASDVSGRKS